MYLTGGCVVEECFEDASASASYLPTTYYPEVKLQLSSWLKSTLGSRGANAESTSTYT